MKIRQQVGGKIATTAISNRLKLCTSELERGEQPIPCQTSHPPLVLPPLFLLGLESRWIAGAECWHPLPSNPQLPSKEYSLGRLNRPSHQARPRVGNRRGPSRWSIENFALGRPLSVAMILGLGTWVFGTSVGLSCRLLQLATQGLDQFR